MVFFLKRNAAIQNLLKKYRDQVFWIQIFQPPYLILIVMILKKKKKTMIFVRKKQNTKYSESNKKKKKPKQCVWLHKKITP